jgi:hypothetical protein
MGKAAMRINSGGISAYFVILGKKNVLRFPMVINQN